MIGDWAFVTAVTVFTFRWGGAAAVGGYVALRLALVAVALPFLSILADRLPRKAFLVGTDLIRAGLVGISAVLGWFGGPPALVLTLAVLAGLVGSPFRPAQAALLPSLASDPHELTAANAVSSTLESLSFFVGPAIAGVLLGLIDVPAIFALNAATFVWSAIMLSGLVVPTAPAPAGPPAGPDDEPSPPTRFFTEAMAGFATIGGDRRLLLVTVLCCVQTIIAGASLVFGVVIAVEVVRLGPEGVGYLDATVGVGAIVGGLVAISRASHNRTARDFGVGVLGWGLPLVIIAVWPSPVTAFLAMVLIGLANPLVDVNLVTLLQRLTPDAVLGRVFGALESAAIATMALGAFVMPLLIHLVGLRWSLVIIGTPLLVGGLASLRALARIDTTVDPPAYLALVQALPLFQPLAPAAQEGLARRLVTVPVTAGQTVITEGEPGDRFYLVESGLLDATRGTEQLSRMGPGDCFGEIALLRDVPRTATVTAVEDAVLHALERDDFLTAVGADAEATYRAEALVSRRSR
jgi:MFS family permease